MQFTSYQKRAGTWGLITAVAAFSLWVLAPVPAHALNRFKVVRRLAAAFGLGQAVRRGHDGYLTSRLYQG